MLKNSVKKHFCFFKHFYLRCSPLSLIFLEKASNLSPMIVITRPGVKKAEDRPEQKTTSLWLLMETLSDRESAEVLSIDMHLWGPCKFGTRAVSGLRSHLRSHTTRAHWVSQEQATIKDLTHLARIVCFSHTFENNFRIKQKFRNFLKECCCLTSC